MSCRWLFVEVWCLYCFVFVFVILKISVSLFVLVELWRSELLVSIPWKIEEHIRRCLGVSWHGCSPLASNVLVRSAFEDAKFRKSPKLMFLFRAESFGINRCANKCSHVCWNHYEKIKMEGKYNEGSFSVTLMAFLAVSYLYVLVWIYLFVCLQWSSFDDLSC